MKNSIVIVIIIFALAIAATYYPWQQTAETESVVEIAAETNTDNFLEIPKSDGESTIKYPVPETSDALVEIEENEEPGSDMSPEGDSIVIDTVEVVVKCGTAGRMFCYAKATVF